MGDDGQMCDVRDRLKLDTNREVQRFTAVCCGLYRLGVLLTQWRGTGLALCSRRCRCVSDVHTVSCRGGIARVCVRARVRVNLHASPPQLVGPILSATGAMIDSSSQVVSS